MTGGNSDPRRPLVLVVAVVAAVIFGTAGVIAAPGEPISFYGGAADADGTPAASGTTIVAAVDGAEIDRITVDEPGVYANDGPTDKKLRTQTGAGETVTFHVGSLDGPQAVESHDIDGSGVFQLDLTFPAGTFVADDSGGGGGSGGGGSGGSGGGSSTDAADRSTTTVTAVDISDEETTDETTDETDGTGEETADTSDRDDTVRVASASASVRGGSTLEITLPSTDGEASTGEDESPGDEPTDDETEQPTDNGVTDTDDANDAEDGGEAAAGDPNQPPPPPVSQAVLERVEIDVSEDVDAEVEIRQSRSPPSDGASEFQRDDGTQAAGYIEVTDNLDDEQVTEGRLTFRVSKSDLETDDAEAQNVALYHYLPETGEWEELDTEVVGETDDYVRFRGTTPGFSQFAAGIKRAQFEISDALVDVQQISRGDSIQVEAIVTNTGGADGTFTTQLLVDSAVVAEDVLTIAAGGQRATTFDYEFEQADTYQVRVNDVITGEIQVIDPSAATESTDNSLPGFGFGTALVTLVVSALLYRRRSR